MIHPQPAPYDALTLVFAAAQFGYLLTFLIEAYFSLLKVNVVDDSGPPEADPQDLPKIILFYPVLRELHATMRTTMTALAKLDYPADRRRIVAIPNADDELTIASLRKLQADFPFLEVLPVPPTQDPRWAPIWRSWSENTKAYWWHRGATANDRALPAKKTRQLIYALYNIVGDSPDPDTLINYIDADSCPPVDHFMSGARGIRQFDVLQAQNVAGNLNASMPASWHALDHMAWDGAKYLHLSAPSQPYWMLGKGLFFRAADLIALGGFHPWITIEDPEVGLRFWINGKRLGVIRGSLIEEVPETWIEGVHQRRRWVCGFFQSLDPSTLGALGFTAAQRFKAWLVFLPCLSLWINAVGAPTGLWALWSYLDHTSHFPVWLSILCAINLAALAVTLAALYWRTWRRTALVLKRTKDRLWYMVRINPISILVWWLLWLIPLGIGFYMYMRNGGLVWRRTEKVDANHDLVRNGLEEMADPANPFSPPLEPAAQEISL